MKLDQNDRDNSIDGIVCKCPEGNSAFCTSQEKAVLVRSHAPEGIPNDISNHTHMISHRSFFAARAMSAPVARLRAVMLLLNETRAHPEAMHV